MKPKSTERDAPGSRKRYLGPLLGAGFLITSAAVALIAILAVTMLNPADAPPIWFVVLYVLISVLIVGGAVTAAVQRIRELRKGEEDEAKKY